MPETIDVSDNIFAKCVPAASIDTSRVDGLTAVNVQATTSAQLEALFKADNNGTPEWIMRDWLLESEWKGKACQPRPNGLADWINAISVLNPKRLSVSSLGGRKYEIQPFVKMEVKDPLYNQSWEFTNGETFTSTSPGGYTGSTWLIRVTSPNDTPLSVRWFPRGTRVTLSGMNSTSSVKTRYEVIDAVNDTTYIHLYLKNISAGSPVPSYKRTDLVTGVLLPGTPNISPYESYCEDIPGLNLTRLVPFWVENRRKVIRQDSEFNEYLSMIAGGNQYFKRFGPVSSVEWQRQVEEYWQQRMVNDFFFNDPYENQSLASYNLLPMTQIYDGDENSPTFHFGDRYEIRKASAPGIYQQFHECSRVFDLQGQVLNLPEFHAELYRVLRVRRANGLEAKFLEVIVPSAFRNSLVQAYIRYFKEKSEGLLSLQQDITKVYAGELGFNYVKIMLDYPAVELRLVSHDAIDDFASWHTSANVGGAGQLMMILDWSTLYPMILDVTKATLTSGDPRTIAAIDHSMLCGPMKAPKLTVDMVSTLMTTVVECPGSNIWIENFSSDIPEHVAKAGTETDLYGDYAEA